MQVEVLQYLASQSLQPCFMWGRGIYMLLYGWPVQSVSQMCDGSFHMWNNVTFTWSHSSRIQKLFPVNLLTGTYRNGQSPIGASHFLLQFMSYHKQKYCRRNVLAKTHDRQPQSVAPVQWFIEQKNTSTFPTFAIFSFSNNYIDLRRSINRFYTTHSQWPTKCTTRRCSPCSSRYTKGTGDTALLVRERVTREGMTIW
jgi:hypothetical protein